MESDWRLISSSSTSCDAVLGSCDRGQDISWSDLSFFFSQNKRIDGRILHVGRTVISCTFFAFWVSSICKANVGKMREISVCCPQSYLSPVDLSSAHSCVKMSHMHKQSAKPHSQPHIRKFVAFPHELQTFAYLLFCLHTHWNAMPKLNQTCTCIFIL